MNPESLLPDDGAAASRPASEGSPGPVRRLQVPKSAGAVSGHARRLPVSLVTPPGGIDLDGELNSRESGKAAARDPMADRLAR